MTDKTPRPPEDQALSLRERYLALRREQQQLVEEIEQDDPSMAASARRIFGIRERSKEPCKDKAETSELAEEAG